MNDRLPTLTIDTGVIPLHERSEFLREGLRDSIGRFEVDPTDATPMRQTFTLHAASAFKVMELRTSPVRAARHGDLGEEELSFNLMRSGGDVHHEQMGRGVDIRPGDGMLVSLYEGYVCTSLTSYHFDVLRLSRRELATRLPDVEAAVATTVQSPSALNLLTHYVDILKATPVTPDDPFGQMVISHVYDLVALAVGPTRDGRAQARDGGLRAARLASVKRFVAERLTDPALNGEAVAARFAFSDRYLRTLFEAEGGFWAYVTRERLGLAMRLLTDPRMAEVKIIDIAYRCGFNSLSAFNRMFARAYGCRPSSLR